MRHAEYDPCPDDPVIWIKNEFDTDGDKYYSYILLYVKDILIIHHDDMTMLKNIYKYFKFNPELISYTDIYIGAKICYHRTKMVCMCGR